MDSNVLFCTFQYEKILYFCLGLWVMAAKFELEELNDVPAARVLILQGLRANSDSKLLWLEVS